MINCLICIEDTILMNRVKTALEDNDNMKCHFTETSDEAVMIIEQYQVDLAVLSLSIPIMNGDELADMIVSNNPNSRFCFLYDVMDIELAVSMFNRFDESGIFEIKVFMPSELRAKIVSQIKSLSEDAELSGKNEAFRKKEKLYKKAMDEISSLLNSRIESYSQINRIYSKSIEYLCNDFDEAEAHEIGDFANCMFGQFIQDVLVSSSDINEVISSLNTDINDTGAQRHFNFTSDIKNSEEDVLEYVCFLAHYLSHFYAKFLERFRIKAELKEGEKAYRMDFLVDTRLGNASEKLLSTGYEVVRSSITGICYKVESGQKDGIIQFRLFFVKKSVNA